MRAAREKRRRHQCIGEKASQQTRLEKVCFFACQLKLLSDIALPLLSSQSQSQPLPPLSLPATLGRRCCSCSCCCCCYCCCHCCRNCCWHCHHRPCRCQPPYVVDKVLHKIADWTQVRAMRAYTIGVAKRPSGHIKHKPHSKRHPTNQYIQLLSLC